MIGQNNQRGVLSEYEEIQDDLIGRWFDKNLGNPNRKWRRYREAMKQTFERIPRSLIALETGTHSPWSAGC
jgi:hypothetical protein